MREADVGAIQLRFLRQEFARGVEHSDGSAGAYVHDAGVFRQRDGWMDGWMDSEVQGLSPVIELVVEAAGGDVASVRGHGRGGSLGGCFRPG